LPEHLLGLLLRTDRGVVRHLTGDVDGVVVHHGGTHARSGVLTSDGHALLLGRVQRVKFSMIQPAMLWREGLSGSRSHGNHRASSSSSRSMATSPPAYCATNPTIS